MIVLGLTGGFHFGSCDAAASLLKDGRALASVEEERVSRVKHSFGIPPARCIKACLDTARVDLRDVDYVVLYVETYPEAVREMREHFERLFGFCPPIECVDHHRAHAASAYYASGFDEAVIVSFDWSGDGTASSIWKGTCDGLERIEVVPRPNSLGVFYAAFTQFLGFERGDEYKVMGLASYGQPTCNLDEFLDVSGETYQLNTELLNKRNRNMHQAIVGEALKNWNSNLRRTRSDPITQDHMNLAASVQDYFEKAVLGLVRRAERLTGCKKLCITGGGGLNCRANGKIVAKKWFEEVYVPPFPNDTGCSFGTAAVLSAEKGIKVLPLKDSFLGPGYDDEAIRKDLELLKCPAEPVRDVAGRVVDALDRGQLVGWFQGRMEVGPRALGARSILADPRDRTVRDRINRHVKFRESFRPFAPSVLAEDCRKWFEFDQRSPFMSFVADVLAPDDLPAITHVDRTARIHTVENDDSCYSRLLQAMKAKTGYSCVLNTSFNYRGQPIVCTPKEAVHTFFGTGLDVLVLGRWLVEKK